MESTTIQINPFLIKDILNTYTNSSSFTNYQKISRDYNKLYSKIIKKLNNYSKDQIRTKVKDWFFNQSLENRIKYCTVENEFLCQIIYQMYYDTQSDKTIKFYLTQRLTDVNELYKIDHNSNKNYFYKLDDYFKGKSEKYSSSSFANKFNIYEGNIYNEDDEENDDKLYNSNIEEFIYGIKFFSVHHKPFPDCFCLSPYLLLQEEKFCTTFNCLGNDNYFNSLIQPYYSNEANIYGYKLPNWMSKKHAYSITQYIIAFIEQTIMIKFILNNYILYNNNNKKNNNKNNIDNTSVFSLINDDILNGIFNDRKTVIKYINIIYKEENLKKELIEDNKIEKTLKGILNNNIIMNKINNFKSFRASKNNYGYASSMLSKPLFGFKNNKFNTVYDDIYSFLNKNLNEQNNYIIRKIKRNITEIIDRKDNIIFVDYLLFQNFKGLWEIEYFILNELIECIIKKFNEQNCNDLIEDTPLKKKNRRKKKKKNQKNENIENNNNNIIDNNNKINNEINLSKIELDCYNEIFKEKEKLLYIPYYFSVDLELKNKYNKIKESKLKLIEKNNKIQDINEISNYVKNEFLLKYILDKVIHLQSENYITFSDNNNIEIINKDKEITISNDLKPIKNNIVLDNTNSDLNNTTINEKEFSIDNIKNNELKKFKKEYFTNNTEKKKKANSTDKIIKINNISEKGHINIIKSKSTNKEKNNITNINTFKDKNKSNVNNKNTTKKSRKSPNMFFLFDTVKNKSKKKPKSKSPNNTKTEKDKHFEFSFIPLNHKSSTIYKDYQLIFMEKLHNNILKNDKKVDNILQLLKNIKNYCIEEIKKIINKAYDDIVNNYSIDLYGSFITGLMIEASDIDIKIKIHDIKKKEFEKYFFILSNKLKEENKFETITPISTASVPVIKLVINNEKFIEGEKDLEKDFTKLKQLNSFKNYLFDKNELLQTKIDITFIFNDNNQTNETINNIQNNNKFNLNLIKNNNEELSSVSYIKERIKEYPEIKPILKLLKRYFYTKKMNYSFKGGLSSYNLFLLILSFAKYQKIYNLNQDKNINLNLGYFLIQFLVFFGKFFDFENYLININSPYIYELNNYIGYNSGKSLIILDPLTGVNASKSSYKINEIQKMFMNGFDFFEKERIIYENEIIKEQNDKKDNDKDNNNEVILGLTKTHKNDYLKKNKKEKVNINIIDKFFFS